MFRNSSTGSLVRISGVDPLLGSQQHRVLQRLTTDAG